MNLAILASIASAGPAPSEPTPRVPITVIAAEAWASADCLYSSCEFCGTYTDQQLFDDPAGALGGSLSASAGSGGCECSACGSGYGYGEVSWGLGPTGGGVYLDAADGGNPWGGGWASLTLKAYRRSVGYSAFDSWLIGPGEVLGLGVCCKLGGGYQCSVLASDINGDWIVDSGDITLVLASWGTNEFDVLADVDLDGVVGPRDLAAVLTYWGTIGGDAPGW